MLNEQNPDNSTKYIGVRIKEDLYWKIREKLLKNKLSMSEAIIKGLLAYLDIKIKEEHLLKDK